MKPNHDDVMLKLAKCRSQRAAIRLAAAFVAAHIEGAFRESTILKQFEKDFTEILDAPDCQ